MTKFTLGVIVGALITSGTFALAESFVRARVNTNGKLVGYIVQKDGEEVCRDPTVSIRFRGPDSYILCD